MKDTELHNNPDIKRLQVSLCLIPIIGLFPPLDSLSSPPAASGSRTRSQASEAIVDSHQFEESLQSSARQPMNREQLAVSRLSVTLAGSWLLSYLLFNTGAEMSEFLSLRLLILNSLLTSGYFITSLWLIVRLWQRQSPRLPGFSSLADQLLGKH